MLKRYPPAFMILFVTAATFAAWDLLTGAAFAELPPPPNISVASGQSSFSFVSNDPNKQVDDIYFRNSGGLITSCESSPSLEYRNGFRLSAQAPASGMNMATGETKLLDAGSCQLVFLPRNAADRNRAAEGLSRRSFTVTAKGPGGESSVVISIEVIDAYPWLDPNGVTRKGEPIFAAQSTNQFSPGDVVDILVPKDHSYPFTTIESCTFDSWSASIANPFTIEPYSYEIPDWLTLGCRIRGTIPRDFLGSLSFTVKATNNRGSGRAVARSIESRVAPVVVAPVNRILTIAKQGVGRITSTFCPDSGCAASIDAVDGNTWTLTATPLAGFIFERWEGCSSSQTSAVCNVTMNGNKAVRAVFSPLISSVALGPCSSDAIGVTLNLGKWTGTQSNACFQYANASSPLSTQLVTDVKTANDQIFCGAGETRVGGVALCVTYGQPGRQPLNNFVAGVVSARNNCPSGYSAATSPLKISSSNQGKTQNGGRLCLRRPSP